MSKGKVVDLFCGAGGASLGFVQAGFEVCGAVDADVRALETYQSNLCDRDLDEYPGSVSFDEPLRADLNHEGDSDEMDDNLPTASFEEICEFFDLDPEDVDGICGCPPCQNFSSLRDTEPWPEGDPKDDLLRSFVTIVGQATPEFVFFENVRGILNAGEDVPTDYVDWLLCEMSKITREDDSLEEGGYGYDFDIVNAANYGVPQRRERTIGLFVYGVDSEAVQIPDETHAERPGHDSDLNEWVGASEHLSQYDLKHDLGPGEKQVGLKGYPDDPAHRARRHHASTIEFLAAIRKHGDSWTDLRGTEDDHLIKDCHRGMEDTSATAAYGIIDGEKPAPTLTTRCTNVSSGRFTHPEVNRAITPREAALLMTFPPWFELPAKNAAAERVIGNAVPPALVQNVIERFSFATTDEGHQPKTPRILNPLPETPR